MARFPFQLSRPGPLRLYSTRELLELPPPTWLIENILPTGALVGLYGPPASTKSFIAMDLALCVSTGTPWHGHAVKRGFVMYVAAEGGPGIGKRIRAWLTHHQKQSRDLGIGWLIEPIMLHGESNDLTVVKRRLDDDINAMPDLIVIDTLARCFAGDENQQEDMGAFIAGVDSLRHEYDATVIAVHHTRLDGERERGNTAFRGAADTMISVKRTKGHIEMSCDKQKDAEHFPPVGFRLKPDLEHDSCIMVCTDNQTDQKSQQILQIIANEPLAFLDWQYRSGLPKSTFARLIVGLRENSKIIKENGKWGLG